MDRQAVPFRRSEPVPGVRLVTERMPHTRTAAIGLWVDRGARDEPWEIAGASHLLEHLLFKGTERRTARDIAHAFDAVGGEVNAFSTKEYTCYYARVLETDVAMATDVLLDMFTSALLREEDLASERKVVLEEIHMTRDAPDDWVHDLFVETAWPDHPLGREVIGTTETVGSMDRNALLAFYREGYTPGRVIVAASGDIDHASLAEQVSAVFEADERFRRLPSDPPQIASGRAVYDQRTIEQVNLVWGAASPPRDSEDRFALSLLNVLYGSSMSSRLFQEIREDRGLAYAVFSGYQSYVESGLFSVYAGTSEATADEVMRIVRSQAASVAAGEVTPEELDRARGHVKGSLVLGLDDPGGRMARLGKGELVWGDVLGVDEVLARIDAVTAEDVTRVAQQVFGGGFVLASVGPVAPGSLDRHTDPL
ncbi:MAG TPA: pitrilysin family protein [Actinomycetota bacterium]|nr:pitrilysin family protein [Actinomycetota bacterium]